eukprot:gnl/Dysnectes_brevis/511_a567_6893.p1 GENE.gnl/Dysnectes_brevis/511_a567_6893~~gnl/Dysnectes_brevis/511_a567_6893.p1  ORF type:complete len:397 (-),score=125.09 gnl/Dysnectes_brevis/511_a567_6893:92-1282(-)
MADKVRGDYLMFLCSDSTGQLRSMEEHRVNFAKYFESGLGIDGSSLPGFAETHRSDVLMKADLDTIRNITMLGEDLSLVICDVHTPEGEPSPGCPRSVLKRVLAKYQARGWNIDTQTELEFYLCTPDGKPQDTASYMDLPPKDKAMPYRRRVAEIMCEAGLSVRRIHHENGHGQNEVELNLQPALKTSDDTVLAAWILEAVAAEMDLKCELSPLPLPYTYGNGLHVHTMVRDADGNNLFYDGSGTLSPWGRSFVAGILKHAREITAVFARSEQTFARFTNEGHEAPININWGAMNREAMVRIPKASSGSIHPEFRAGDYSGSIHLLTAVLLEAGLRGVDEGLELAPEAESQGMLPTTASESLDIMKVSEFIEGVLGDHMKKFLISRPLSPLSEAKK